MCLDDHHNLFLAYMLTWSQFTLLEVHKNTGYVVMVNVPVTS